MSISNDPLRRPDPFLGANWNDGHVPAPAEHIPTVEQFQYYLDDHVGFQVEFREIDSGACIVSNNPDALPDLEAWR